MLVPGMVEHKVSPARRVRSKAYNRPTVANHVPIGTVGFAQRFYAELVLPFRSSHEQQYTTSGNSPIPVRYAQYLDAQKKIWPSGLLQYYTTPLNHWSPLRAASCRASIFFSIPPFPDWLKAALTAVSPLGFRTVRKRRGKAASSLLGWATQSRSLAYYVRDQGLRFGGSGSALRV